MGVDQVIDVDCRWGRFSAPDEGKTPYDFEDDTRRRPHSAWIALRVEATLLTVGHTVAPRRDSADRVTVATAWINYSRAAAFGDLNTADIANTFRLASEQVMPAFVSHLGSGMTVPRAEGRTQTLTGLCYPEFDSRRARGGFPAQ